MASTRTRPKTVRITNEAADFYEKVPLNRVAESVYGLLSSGLLEFDGEEIKIPSGGGVYTEKRSLAYEDIAFMASLCEMSMERVEEEVSRLMNEGVLVFVGGKIGIELPSWAKSFEEVCHDRGVDTEKVAEAAIKAIKRGTL